MVLPFVFVRKRCQNDRTMNRSAVMYHLKVCPPKSMNMWPCVIPAFELKLTPDQCKAEISPCITRVKQRFIGKFRGVDFKEILADYEKESSRIQSIEIEDNQIEYQLGSFTNVRNT